MRMKGSMHSEFQCATKVYRRRVLRDSGSNPRLICGQGGGLFRGQMRVDNDLSGSKGKLPVPECGWAVSRDRSRGGPVESVAHDSDADTLVASGGPLCGQSACVGCLSTQTGTGRRCVRCQGCFQVAQETFTQSDH